MKIISLITLIIIATVIISAVRYYAFRSYKADDALVICPSETTALPS